jgi:phosphoribosyl-ATP pyrophosphohydrolase
MPIKKIRTGEEGWADSLIEECADEIFFLLVTVSDNSSIL